MSNKTGCGALRDKQGRIAVEADAGRGYLRIGCLLNKVEVRVPEGHTCVADGFRIRKGKVTRKGSLTISKTPNEDRKTRIEIRGFLVEG